MQLKNLKGQVEFSVRPHRRNARTGKGQVETGRGRHGATAGGFSRPFHRGAQVC